jgi:hypothetical protein
MVLRKKQFGGHNVLADFANMLPRKHRRFDFNAAVSKYIDVFDHDHGIGIDRHHMSGVYVKS